MKVLRKVSIFATCFLFALCSLFIGLGLSGKLKTSEAVSTTDTFSYVKVDEIWNGSSFTQTNVNKLLQIISGSSSVNMLNMGTINTMATNKTTSADIRAKTYGKTSLQDVVVRFAGLDWQVIYLSKDKSGNPILTLWLSNSTQEAWSGRTETLGSYFSLSNGNLTSSWSANWNSSTVSDEYPSNMYGSSYIRAVALNNGGSYATSATTLAYSSQSSSHVFSKFTMPDVSGSVTKFLVKPAQVTWQEYGQSTTIDLKWSKSAPNENWSSNIPNSGTYNGVNYNFGSGFNFAGKSLNSVWKDDYLWLPSVSEACKEDDSRIGFWKTSSDQCDNNGTDSALRSGSIGVEGFVYHAKSNGKYSIPTSATKVAVRPALHLNLNEVVKKIPDYTFVQNYGGGTYGGLTSAEPKGVDIGERFVFNTPTYSGRTLTGWYCSYNGKTYKVARDGSFSFPSIPDIGAAKGTTITFTAQWSGNEVMVIAAANGGSISSTSGWTGTGLSAYKNVRYASTYGTLPTASRTGYSFSGWYTALSGGTQITASTFVNNTSTHIIYARWSSQTYPIVFNSNDGTNQTRTQSAYYGSSITLYANTFTRSGYIFAGWSTSSTSNYVSYTDGQTYTQYSLSTVNLYAVWKKVSTTGEEPVLNNGKYEIASKANLVWMSEQSQTASLTGSYIQTASIDLSGDLWRPIGNSTYPFRGTYDGNGFIISNLQINSKNSYQGLFGYTEVATLKNIYIASGRITGSSYVGGIVGYSISGTIENCTNYCNIESNSYSVGGIAGYSGCIISGCRNYGDVSGNYQNIGGIVGSYGGIFITKCVVKANISIKSGGPPYAGGIVGNASGAGFALSSSYFEGTICSEYSFCGALVGYAYINGGNGTIAIEDCYAKAYYPLVSSTNNYGLIYGYYGELSLNNVIFEVDGYKSFTRGDYPDWYISTSGKLIPSELSWLGVYDNGVSAETLQDMGYTYITIGE